MPSTPLVSLLACATVLVGLSPISAASGTDGGVDTPAVRDIVFRPVLDKPRVVIDPVPPDTVARRARTRNDTSAAASFGLDQTFRLHSQPAAARTIYLDFDGMDIAGTRWNLATDGHPALAAGSQPGWSLDASAAFSDAERGDVQDIWQAVAEDYAPFSVDVTTEPPSAARLDRSSSLDQEYGVTALVTGAASSGAASSSADNQLCGGTCGGVAYNDVFAVTSTSGNPHSQWQPAFVFPEHLSDDPHAIADTISHEVGHNLGLDHDGSTTSAYYGGQGAWGPIMGAPSAHPITQWSRGEYVGATSTQDDLAIIGAASGAPTRADDVGGTVGSASPLPAPTGTPAATGTISTAADVDVFSLGDCTGNVSITANPAASFSPDLDLSVSVLGAGGAVLAGPYDPVTSGSSRTVATGLGGTLDYDPQTTRSLWVAIDGVGSGDPRATGYSDYASLGRYLVSVNGSCTGARGTPSSPTAVTASASGTSITVNWATPVGNGGSAITSYTVSLSPGATQQVVGAAARSATFTGLAPGGQYVATVVARNADAQGPPGSVLVTVPAVAPGAPTEVHATASVDGSAFASWVAPTSNGGAEVNGYRLVVPGLLDENVSADVNGLRVTGLQPGADLTFSVSARNSSGLGTATSVAFTVPGGSAGAVRGPARLTLLRQPTVVGTPRVGGRLVVRRGTWNRAVTLTYQWYAGRSAVRRATRSSYRPRAAQIGRKLSVRVTATAAGIPPAAVRVSTRTIRR